MAEKYGMFELYLGDVKKRFALKHYFISLFARTYSIPPLVPYTRQQTTTVSSY